MANRFDLTLQGGPNTHDTCCHARPHMSTVPILTLTSEPRLPKPGEGSHTVNSQRTRRRHPIQHPPTSTPSVAGRNSNYRCKAVHSLPVSTTSYFRHIVSTVQSSVIRANNGTVLNRHRWKLIFSSIPFLYSKPFPPGLQFYFPLWFPFNNFAIKQGLITRE